jgi:hypothetical protein
VRVATGSEIAHFATAREFPNSVIGIGDLPGVYSLAQQIPLEDLFYSTSYHDLMLSSHEIGHNFNGVHEEADQWCDTEFLGFCLDHDQTIMWPVLHSDNQPFFSDGTRNSGHNNRRRIATNMATGRSMDFPV